MTDAQPIFPYCTLVKMHCLLFDIVLLFFFSPNAKTQGRMHSGGITVGEKKEQAFVYTWKRRCRKALTPTSHGCRSIDVAKPRQKGR